MDKKEILRRAQNAGDDKHDEMYIHVETTSSKFAIIIGGVVCLLLMAIKMAVGVPWQDVYSIWCVMAGTMNLYQWKKLQVKNQLYLGIVWYISALCLIIQYLLEVLGL